MARRAEDLPTLPERPAETPRRGEVAASPGDTPRPPGSGPDSESVKHQRVLGRYRVLFRLASGGMGSVYAAVLAGAHGVDRAVAIKLLNSRDRTPEDVAAFVQEAKVTARLSHPNVIETFELGTEAGEPFIVMPLVRGVSLARLLAVLNQRGERLDPAQAAWIAMQVATGLHAAHELRDEDGTPLGVVHRDVSPQNVLVSYDGRVLLVDFGVAKLFEAARATVSGVIKGKFGYMAPEQIRGELVDRRTDLFALGVVLYEMLTGRRLYADLAPAQATFKIACDPVPKVRDVVESVPEELDAVVARCLAKEKSDRYATATELRDALRAFLKARSANVDESDVAGLVDELFAEDRAALEEKIRAAIAGRTDDAPVEQASAISQASKVTMTTPTSAALPMKKSGIGPVSVALGLVAIAGLGIVGARAAGVFDTAAPAAPATATASGRETAAATAVAPATPPPVVTGAEEPSSAPQAASAELAPRASASAARDKSMKPAAKLTQGGATTTAPAVPPPPPSSSSHRGVPFRNL